jgi:hypothetical protein
MAEANQGYRKKQAFMVLAIFACFGVAIFFSSAAVAVGSILVACGIAFWASTLEPAKKPDEHHH